MYIHVQLPTASPSAVRGHRSTDQSNTTITITWTQPSSLGERDDVYYSIEYREQGSLDDFQTAGREDDTGATEYTHTIADLNPVTDYLIRVIAENGVSDQDPDPLDGRTVEIRARTQEGRKSAENTLSSFLVKSEMLLICPLILFLLVVVAI